MMRDHTKPGASERAPLPESLPQATLDALSAHIAVLDETGGVITVNHAWRAFAEANPPLSATVNEGANYLAVCDAAAGPDADIATAVAAGIRAVIRGDESAFEVEYPCHSPDTQRWFLGRVSRFPGAGVSRVVVAHENITARKQAEHALQTSETRYRRLFESARDGILILDAESGRIVDVNPFMIDLLGYSHAGFVGKQLWEIGVFKDIAASKQAFFDLQAQGYVRYEDLPLETRDGRHVAVEFVSNVYPVNHHHVIQCNIRDITARKRADAEHNELQAQLLQAQKLESIGTLAGGVAHEINNPIMGIMNYAQLIVDELGPGSTATEYADEIGKETERVATIVRNLLSFARVDKETHKSPARLCDIVNDTLSLIRAVMRHDQITLEENIPADLPRILCRSQQIRQVLMNLLTNARDALNQKYPRRDANKKVIIEATEMMGSFALDAPQVRLTDDADRHIRAVRLTVEDHGAGIPEALRARIMDPFFSTKSAGKGTGLGLSISHGIIKDHGGNLTVESEVGQWTRFHVDLPAVQTEVPWPQTPPADPPISDGAA